MSETEDKRDRQDLLLSGSGSLLAGKRHGIWLLDFDDGSLLEVTYDRGELDGPFTFWGADGVTEEGIYRQNRKHGPNRCVTPGQSEILLSYVRGVVHGKATITRLDSDRVIERDYRHGKRHGKVRIYESGRLLEEARWHFGVRQGLTRGWHENGAVAFEMSYAHGVAEGPCRSWFPDGTPESEGQMADNEQHGEWRWYTESGALGWREIWDHGQLVARIPEDEADLTRTPPRTP